MTTFLEQFLDLGLLAGVDDASFGKLDAAATDLADTLKSDAKMLRRYAYALLDAHLSDTDPTFDGVEEVIKKEWRTLRSSYPPRPVQLLRAVLGQAIVRAVAKAEFPAETILWLTASSTLPYSNLDRERQLIEGLFKEFGRKAEEEALSAWDLADISEPTSIRLPQKPTFAVESAAINVGKTSDQIPEYMDGVAGALSEALTSIQTRFIQSVSGSQTRLKLLWWKEALYSPSQETGYRRIESPIALVVTLAYDFHELLPETYPHSAEYFLREAVYDVLHKHDGPCWSLSEFCSEFKAAGGVTKQLAQLTKGIAGRVTLLVFLGELARGEAKAEDAFRRVGIGMDVRLSADDMAVWVLRELQASALANQRGLEA